jgi:hypothetical protein
MAFSLFVIPGRAKHEPGISRHNLQIPGSTLARRPGMTDEALRQLHFKQLYETIVLKAGNVNALRARRSFGLSRFRHRGRASSDKVSCGRASTGRQCAQTIILRNR